MIAPKLGRTRDHRNRTIRNLATSLVLYEKITTTEAKAKAVIPVVERLLTMARKENLTARRYAKSLLFDNNAVQKLFEDFPQRWGTRTSGFVRSTKGATRPGDGSSMVHLEILMTPLEEILKKETQTTTKVRRKAATPAPESSTEDKAE